MLYFFLSLPFKLLVDHAYPVILSAGVVPREIVGREDAFVGDDAVAEFGRRDVEGRVETMHAPHGGANAHRLEDIVLVALLDFHGIDGGVLAVGRARAEVGDAPVGGREGDLEGADLVDDVAVHADDVGGRSEDVDVFGLHGVAGHVVGDDGDVEVHVAHDGGGEAGALEVGSGFGADDLDDLASSAAFTEHRADDGFGKALGHDGAVVGELIHEVFRARRAAGVTLVGGFYAVLENSSVGSLTRRLGRDRHLDAGFGYGSHLFGGGGAGVGDFPGCLGDTRVEVVRAFGGDLVSGKGHAHASREIGSARLGDHGLDGRDHFFVAPADSVLDAGGVDPAVEDAHGSFLIPGDVLVVEHEGKVFVLAFHNGSLSRNSMRWARWIFGQDNRKEQEAQENQVKILGKEREKKKLAAPRWF